MNGAINSLPILGHEAEHASDYAAALNDYGGLCSDAGQFEVAAALAATSPARPRCPAEEESHRKTCAG